MLLVSGSCIYAQNKGKQVEKAVEAAVTKKAPVAGAARAPKTPKAAIPQVPKAPSAPRVPTVKTMVPTAREIQDKLSGLPENNPLRKRIEHRVNLEKYANIGQ